MMHKKIELSLFLDAPVAFGLDAVEDALALYKTSRGEARASAKQILLSLKKMFSKLAPKCKSASRWEELKCQIQEEIR